MAIGSSLFMEEKEGEVEVEVEEKEDDDEEEDEEEEECIFGRVTGSCSFGTGTTVPQSSQWIIGMGAPQYLCRETNQSLSLYCTLGPPVQKNSKHSQK